MGINVGYNNRQDDLSGYALPPSEQKYDACAGEAFAITQISQCVTRTTSPAAVALTE